MYTLAQSQTKTPARKRVNFMISTSLLTSLTELIPLGERSDFVNQTLEEALTQVSRQKASEALAEFRKTNHLKTSTKEILKIIHDGRKNLL
jgi:hypothetical protein